MQQHNAKQYLAISLTKLATVATELAYASVQLGEVQLDRVDSEIEAIVRKHICAIFTGNSQLSDGPAPLGINISEMTQMAIGGYCSPSFYKCTDVRTLEYLKGELKLAIAIVTREYTKKCAHLRVLHGVFV